MFILKIKDVFMYKDEENNTGASGEQILNELKGVLADSKKILALLKPLTEEGEIYKGIFKDIRNEIEKSYSEVKNTKTLNTKFSNDLKKSKEQIESFLVDVKSKQRSVLKVISDIKKIENNADLRFQSLERLRDDANDNKKFITSIKNDVKELLESIKKIRGESLEKIKLLRAEKRESEKIVKFLKLKETEVNKLSDIINNKYRNLFITVGPYKKTKIQEFDDNIKKAKEFNQKLNNEIQPNLDDKQQFLNDLENKIIEKNIQIDSLLSNATAGTLDEGYLESMYEYSIGAKLKFIEFRFKTIDSKKFKPEYIFLDCLKLIKGGILNLYILVHNMCFRYLRTVFNYMVFIIPLVCIVLIFITPDIFDSYLKFLSDAETKPTFSELLLFKTVISLPLLWVSWYGQKSISQRKRLFEEYNHKSRVVRMYIMFRENDQSYKLDNFANLEKTLIDAIANNPAKNLGKGESFIDKVIEKFYTAGFYKRLKNELIDDLMDVKSERLKDIVK